MLTRTLPPDGKGGLAAAGADLAGALVRAGAEVRIVTPGESPASWPAGLAVQALVAPAGRYSRAWWRESARTYDRSGRGVDVVLGVSAAANALAARRRSSGIISPRSISPGPAFVFQAHGTAAGEIVSKLGAPRPRAVAGALRNAYWGLVRDRAYQDYDAVVAVGEAVRRQLSAWPTCRLVGDTPVHLIRNGVDPALFRFDPQARRRLRARLALPDSAPLALFASRLQADKGSLEALEAFHLALPQRPDLRLAFVGDGPEHARLERRIARLGLHESVHVAGHAPREDLAAWFSAADGLIFPTRRAEGLPLVVLEALAAGLPVLTTPQGAADPELPCDRLPAGHVDRFAAALTRLSTDLPRGSRLPEAFHLDHSARRYLDLFERLLSTRARRACTDLAA